MNINNQLLISKIRPKLLQYIKEKRLADAEGKFRCFKCGNKNMKSRTEYYATAQIEYNTKKLHEQLTFYQNQLKVFCSSLFALKWKFKL